MSPIDERPVDGPLLDQVRREWPLDGADRDADVQAWRLGTGLYEDDDEDEDDGTLLRAGDLMALAVRHHLHGEDVLRDDDLAVTVHSLLFAATTPLPGTSRVPAGASRLVRLALAVVKQRGWQPASRGGNGQIAAELFEDDDIAHVLAEAIAPVDLVSFFADARR